MSPLNEYRGHALVRNTSLGIGAAIASRLLHDDWHVTGLDRAEKTISAPYFASLTHDLLDARSALVAIEVDAFRSWGRFHARRRTWQLRPCCRYGHVGRKRSRSDATRQRLPREGRIRAACDGNADAGRFGPGQRATRLPRSAALSGPRKSPRPPRFCCPKRLPRSRANSS
jgi:NAD(P)-dependent dehydrogenase (short-subunit alcohol dehydrogenase family)